MPRLEAQNFGNVGGAEFACLVVGDEELLSRMLVKVWRLAPKLLLDV
jgi:hypothetical protein